MKLTGAQATALRNVLDKLNRAQEYIQREDVAICRRMADSTQLCYHRADGKASLVEVHKVAGSDLRLLASAIRDLRAFLGDDSGAVTLTLFEQPEDESFLVLQGRENMFAAQMVEAYAYGLPPGDPGRNQLVQAANRVRAVAGALTTASKEAQCA